MPHSEYAGEVILLHFYPGNAGMHPDADLADSLPVNILLRGFNTEEDLRGDLLSMRVYVRRGRLQRACPRSLIPTFSGDITDIDPW